MNPFQTASVRPTTSGPSFLSLLDLHSELDELFLKHQDALVSCDLDLARRRFSDYRRAFDLHAHHEEEWLLPLYEEHDHAPRERGEHVRAEHAKLRGMLESIGQRIERLAAKGRATPREIVETIDAEAAFKHLFEHHDGREARTLFPGLDRLLSAEERRELIARCLAEWSALPHRRPDTA